MRTIQTMGTFTIHPNDRKKQRLVLLAHQLVEGPLSAVVTGTMLVLLNSSG